MPNKKPKAEKPPRKVKKRPYKKAVKKPARKGGATITMRTYRALRRAYLERPSISYAAKEAGVQDATARFYIIEGRPEKNMPAIEGLAKRAAKKEEAELELDLRSFRNQYRAELAEAMQGSMLEIRLHNERTRRLAQLAKAEKDKGDKGEIISPSSKFFEQVKSHDMMIRLMERSLGEPDGKVTVEANDFTKQMTAEECVLYITNGDVPERLR